MKKFYLVGAIADVKDTSYITWRDRVTDFLHSLGYCEINPLKEQKGMGRDLKDELMELRLAGKIDEVKRIMEDYVLPADKERVLESDGIIAYIEEYTVGTIRELSLAYEWNKPIYVITSIKLPSNSLIGLATKLFASFEEFEKYFRELSKGQ